MEVVNLIVCMLFGGAVLVIGNPIYSLLSLLCVCFSLVSILLNLGAEYYAVLVILVYIGAIVVLFLYVVMILNIRVFEFSSRNILNGLVLMGISGVGLFVQGYSYINGIEENYGFKVLTNNLENIGIILYDA